MSDKICLEKIEEDFNKFNLSPERIPVYENPRQFSQSFKLCSIVEYKNISVLKHYCKKQGRRNNFKICQVGMKY